MCVYVRAHASLAAAVCTVVVSRKPELLSEMLLLPASSRPSLRPSLTATELLSREKLDQRLLLTRCLVSGP